VLLDNVKFLKVVDPCVPRKILREEHEKFVICILQLVARWVESSCTNACGD
jgi:hypothetical protein